MDSYTFQLGFLWFAIVGSAVVLLGYEIWNIITVAVWFSRFKRKKEVEMES